MAHKAIIFIIAGIGIVAMFLINLFVGTVSIPASSVWETLMGSDAVNASWQFIILQSRLPQAMTALLAGGALSVCGLLMQAAFRNPLADPSVLGVSSGSGLGVAIVMLCMGGNLMVGNASLNGFIAMLLGAFVGAIAVTMLMLALSEVIKSNALLLIVGMLVGYLTSSVIIILNFFASADGIRSYMLWGMGNFASVSTERLTVFAFVTLVCLAVACTLVKPLNAIALGLQYAKNLGIDIYRLRNIILLVTGLLTAVVTAFCGPIAFVGLAVPHMARLLLPTDDYRFLLPLAILMGMLVTLTCNLVCSVSSDGGVMPVNALTPIAGIPVILYIMLKRHF